MHGVQERDKENIDTTVLDNFNNKLVLKTSTSLTLMENTVWLIILGNFLG